MSRWGSGSLTGFGGGGDERSERRALIKHGGELAAVERQDVGVAKRRDGGGAAGVLEQGDFADDVTSAEGGDLVAFATDRERTIEDDEELAADARFVHDGRATGNGDTGAESEHCLELGCSDGRGDRGIKQSGRDVDSSTEQHWGIPPGFAPHGSCGHVFTVRTQADRGMLLRQPSHRCSTSRSAIRNSADITDLNDRSINVPLPSSKDLVSIGAGYHEDPAASMSLRADAYTSPTWFPHEQQATFARTWQWIDHVENVREPGRYVTAQIAGMSIVVVQTQEDELKAF